jgi:long-chain acyl-CoA synthetase
MESLSWVAGHVARNAPRPFLIDVAGGRTWTYAEFDLAARSLASRMSRLGARRGDRVAVLLDNCPEFAVLYFACLRLGASAAPILPSWSRGDVDYLATHLDASLIVLSERTRGAISTSAFESFQRRLWIEGRRDGRDERTRWSLDDPLGAEAADDSGLEDAAADDYWTITFTSGTTSRPKGVVHRIGSLFGAASAFARAMGYDDATRLYHVSPMAYMAGFLNTLLCPFVVGGCVVLDRPFDAKMAIDFWCEPMRRQANRLSLTPTMMATILRLDRGDLGPTYASARVKSVSVCTAPLPAELKREFEERYGVEALETYGLSETLFVSTNRPGAAREGCVGPPIDSVEVEVRGEDGTRLPRGQAGEIFVRTPHATAGYFDPSTHGPDASTAPEWFPTGDLGALDSSGALHVTGRKKDLIVRGGVNVSPRAVEEAIRRHPGVRDVAVVGVPHELYGEEIAAVVELNSGWDWETIRDSLARHGRELLSESCRPGVYYETPSLPRSATGKVQKNSLRSMLAHPIPAGVVA